jgi:hypothetical protein
MSDKNIELKVELTHLDDYDIARKVFNSLSKAFSAAADNPPSHDWVELFEATLKQSLHDSIDSGETDLSTISYQHKTSVDPVEDENYDDYLIWDCIAGLDDGFNYSPRRPRRGSYDDDDDWLSADD